jgi:putative transposase
VIGLGTFLRAWLLGSTTIALENLALRHQLLVLQRSAVRPHLSRWDRILWVWLSRLWTDWRASLVIVQPATVLAWHRRGFQLYWRWKSRASSVGRPRLDPELRQLIRRMARENPTWGRRRMRAELALLGYCVAELTVARYMHRPSPRPAPTWRAFLTTHARDSVAVDFFLVPTLTFRLLFVFVVLRHDRRELLHLNVTEHSTAVWTARQIVEVFPNETAPRYLLRDRDAVYGECFTRCLANMGIREVIIAPTAPWQNPFVERVIGSIRRECLDHCLILNEAHLRRLLHDYIGYYNTARPHQSLATTVPSHARCIRPSLGAWCPSHRSVGSITSASGRPDRGRSPGPRSLIRITQHRSASGDDPSTPWHGGGRAWQSRSPSRLPTQTHPPPRVGGSPRSVRGGF